MSITYTIAVCDSNGHVCAEVNFDSEEARAAYRRRHRYQHEDHELNDTNDIEYVTSALDCYSVEVADVSFGEYKLLHREFFIDFSDAEDRFNANCIHVFADGMYGDPEQMEVSLTDTSLDMVEIIETMNLPDYEFLADGGC